MDGGPANPERNRRDEHARLDRSRYELVVEDDFDDPELDERLWLPHYLPHWSSRARTCARYEIRDSLLRLRIDEDQEPWSAEFDGPTRTSSLQTGVFSGPLGSPTGQLHFRPDLVVREEQPATRLFTPRGGLFEARARVPTDRANMAALWMIGFEDEPDRSGEICIFEIFGRNTAEGSTRIGMGIHPFADTGLVDDFTEETLAIDASDFHVYAAEWTSTSVRFFVDDTLVKVSDQSPAYPMQFMLGIYEFGRAEGEPWTTGSDRKTFDIDWFRAWRDPLEG